MSDEKNVPPLAPSNAETPRENEKGLSRRRFLKSMGASGAAVAGGAIRPVQAAESSAITAPDPATTEARSEAAAPGVPLSFTVNGQLKRIRVAPNAILLDVLRDTLDLTGTKKGCDHGQCGACTMHVNGVAINACLSLAVMHEGDAMTTIEGLGTPDRLHPVQEAFWEHDAYQCGFCTPGQIMSAVAVLHDKRISADDHSLKEAMSGNICRCGAYKNIVAAIQSTRVNKRGAR